MTAALGVIMADPDSMREAMKEWMTKEEGGQTAELQELQASVASLAEHLEKDAHWEGEAFNAFNELLKEFTKQTGNAAMQRDSVGNALKSSAKLYDVLSWVAVAVAAVMAIIARYLVVTRANPPAAPAGEAAAAAGVQTLWTKLKPVMRGLLTMAFTVGGTYQVVQMMSMNQMMKFQSMEAMPMYNSLALGNDANSGALIPVTIEDKKTSGLTVPGQTAPA
ncbi:WXG100 family type VII secretion target [Nonomuraea cavernae]|uniref:WXG100 family type VII secretion target n=1 Tax=Nonomuraea cavernae TaxID=2045107 RepID=UPI00166C1B78|nr:WXG100 family type VII secretion target [Nonomuraea cavernae]